MQEDENLETFNEVKNEEQKTQDNAKKTVQAATNVAANAFGGPVAGKALNLARKVPIARGAVNSIENKLANRVARAGKVVPGLNNTINAAGDSGALDAVNSVASGSSGIGSGGLPKLPTSRGLSNSKKASNNGKKGAKGELAKEGIKQLWEKVPPMVKLYIILGLVVVALIILVIAFISSYNSYSTIEQANELSDVSNEEFDDEFDKEFQSYWYELCDESDENCTEEQIEQDKKIKEDQTAFYKKLNKLIDKQGYTSEQEKRIRAIIISTLMVDVSIDEFIGGEDGAFVLDSTDEMTDEEIYSTEDANNENVYEIEKDTIKELLKQFELNIPICKYEALDTITGTITEQSYEFKDSENNAYSLNYFQRISLKYLKASGLDDNLKAARSGCLANLNATIDFKKTKYGSSSENNYYNYLLSSDFLDKRTVLKSRYSEYARSNNLSENIDEWEPKYRIAVRTQIVEDIKDMVDSYTELVEDDDTRGTLALLTSSYCTNGITVSGNYAGTYDLDEYVMGVINKEFGSLITGYPEAAKVAAIAARSYAIGRTNNCSTPIDNSQGTQTFSPISESDANYDLFYNAVKDTAGQVLVSKKDGSVKGGNYVSEPGQSYITIENGIVSFDMEGLAGYASTAYVFSMPEDDYYRIRQIVGYLPPGDQNHHWGVSQYSIRKMAEDGMTYMEIVESTYLVGGELMLAKSLGGQGLTSNSDGTFLARLSQIGTNVFSELRESSFFNMKAGNVGECAWYAQERADEILSTMSWTKTSTWLADDGNGGNGGCYCVSSAYKDYKHYWDVNDSNTFKPGRIIVWRARAGVTRKWGHVAIIEEVIGNKVIYSEGYDADDDSWQWAGTQLKTIGKDIGYYGKNYDFQCTIDLSEIDNGASFNQEPKKAWAWNGQC